MKLQCYCIIVALLSLSNCNARMSLGTYPSTYPPLSFSPQDYSIRGAHGPLRSPKNMRYSFDDLISRLDESNSVLNDLVGEQDGQEVTFSEIDYLAEEAALRRAWAKNSAFQRHETERNMKIAKLALENVENVLNTAKCQDPIRRCLAMHKLKGAHKYKYWPNCALVHRCGDDAGCCTKPEHTCTALQSQPIGLYFLKFELGLKKRAGVEYFKFENHTKCGCRPLADTYTLLQMNKEKSEEEVTDIVERDSVFCECPKYFQPKANLISCRCECDPKRSRVCRKVKKGKRSYHLNGKGCKVQCGEPACEYGNFIQEFGRCPRKKERTRRK